MCFSWTSHQSHLKDASYHSGRTHGARGGGSGGGGVVKGKGVDTRMYAQNG